MGMKLKLKLLTVPIIQFLITVMSNRRPNNKKPIASPITYKSPRFKPVNRTGRRIVIDYSSSASRAFSPVVIPCNRLILPNDPKNYFYYAETQLDSWSVFCDRLILPYYLKPDRNASPRVKQQLREAVYDAYSPQVSVPRTTGYLYHIAADCWCDDLGRFYYQNSKGFQWSPITMRFHNDRPDKQITKTYADGTKETLTLPTYWWIALAGLRPADKVAAVNSSEYDVHHIDENPCDFHPSHLQVVPTYLHRRHHTLRNPITVKFFQ